MKLATLCAAALTFGAGLFSAAALCAPTSTGLLLDSGPYNFGPEMSPIAVASNASGDFAGAWSSAAGVNLQIFFADGTPKGPPSTIPPSALAYNGYNGRLAISDNGEVAAVWVESTQPSATTITFNVLLQRFDVTGAPIGAPVTIHTETDPNGVQGQIYQQFSSFALDPLVMNGNGDLAVAWTFIQMFDLCSGGPGCTEVTYRVSRKSYALVDKADGGLVGPRLIDMVPNESLSSSKVAFTLPVAMHMAGDGSLDVLFSNTGAYVPGQSVFLRRYASTLLAAGGKIPLALPAGDFNAPLLQSSGLDAAGNAYLLLQPRFSIGATVYKFDSTGALVGNTETITDTDEELAVAPNGEFAVATLAGASPASFGARLYDGNMVPIGSPWTQALDSSYFINSAQSPPLASLSGNGNLVVIAGEVSNSLNTTQLLGLLVQP